MSRDFYMIDENALPRGRWFLGDFRSTNFEDRKRLDRREPCTGTFTIDPGSGGNALNFSLTAFGLPIATVPVAEAIAAIADADVHLVPARIKGYGEFRFVQCLRVVDCVDESHSIFETFEEDAPIPSMRGEYSGFSRLVVEEPKIPADAHMFFVARWCVRPVVSRKVTRALLDAGGLGVRFVPVSHQ